MCREQRDREEITNVDTAESCKDQMTQAEYNSGFAWTMWAPTYDMEKRNGVVVDVINLEDRVRRGTVTQVVVQEHIDHPKRRLVLG